ncbi:MFS transporter [Reticulibacter mediterranei]|uniref:MFS transporter n=1 Tax=Reticulibacter mediterranei TaxID=2778369 RepID=A0A8J3IP90_9CHLR|nr:MFS transporter [Reticulibacter mediterranei]GHO97653.1 MFS transporter [Reticulibacter mediterranei]
MSSKQSEPSTSTNITLQIEDELSRQTINRSLWRHGDFMKFWLGETVSLFGTQVSLLALPLTAVLVLNVNAEQLGVLRFLETFPYALFPLLFGVWVDRVQKRPLMIVANAARAVLIGLLPCLAFWHELALPPLYGIAFCVGIFTVLFDVCWQSFLPVVVSQARLIEANGKVATSSAAAEVGGPGLAGLLIQVFTAPIALFADSLSYVVSVVSLLLIRQKEAQPQRNDKKHLWHDIAEGLRFASGNPSLRTLAVQAAGWNFCFLLVETIFLIYAPRVLGFSPGLLGLVYAVGAIGGLLGAGIASSLARHFRLGWLLCGTFTLGTVPMLLIPLATGPLAPVICGAALFLIRTALGIWFVLTTTLRQSITPPHLLGRVSASLRLIAYSGSTIGALVAGYLSSVIGLRAGLWVGSIGFIITLLPIFFSPLPRLHTMPDKP